ncbi:MAG: hypothetical protein AAF617_05655 [Bacteroidota bacterium]
MKKKNLSKLTLRKAAISKLDNIYGGLAATDPIVSSKPEPSPTNMWSNCVECESARRTQCKNECPNFTKAACGNISATPTNPIQTVAVGN